MTLNPSDDSKNPPIGAELQITCHVEKAPCNCSPLHPLALKHHRLSYRGQVLSAGLQPVHFQHHFLQCTDRILQTYVFLLNLSIQKLCYKWRNAKEIVILQQHPKKPSDIEYKMCTISTFLSDLFSLSLLLLVFLLMF